MRRMRRKKRTTTTMEQQEGGNAHASPQIRPTHLQIARFCPLQDVARFHLLCRAWCEGLEQSAFFYPEVSKARERKRINEHRKAPWMKRV
jgi:hypothetical protein